MIKWTNVNGHLVGGELPNEWLNSLVFFVGEEQVDVFLLLLSSSEFTCVSVCV